jgi:hypothetical protein
VRGRLGRVEERVTGPDVVDVVDVVQSQMGMLERVCGQCVDLERPSSSRSRSKTVDHPNQCITNDYKRDWPSQLLAQAAAPIAAESDASAGRGIADVQTAREAEPSRWTSADPWRAVDSSMMAFLGLVHQQRQADVVHHEGGHREPVENLMETEPVR